MRRYAVDGMVVATPLEVPGLAAAAEAGDGVDWTVEVVGGPGPGDDGVSWTGHAEGPEGLWARFGRDARGARVVLEGVCTLVANPRERRASIHRSGDRGDDVHALRRCLPYLVALGPRLALHAACAVLGRGAVAFCGAAGAGKSTLALALDAAGVAVLADDHVAVDVSGPEPRAFPSFPSVEVGRASRDAFRPGAPGGDEKGRLPLVSPRPPGPVPLVALAFVERGAAFAARTVEAKEAAPRLVRDAVLAADPGVATEDAARFEAVARLAEAVPALALVLPEGLERLAASVPAIRARLSGTPA